MNIRCHIFSALICLLASVPLTLAEAPQAESRAEAGVDQTTSLDRPILPKQLTPKFKPYSQQTVEAVQQALKPWQQSVAEKPWHQRVVEFMSNKINAASEYVKNTIDDVTKAPRKTVKKQNGDVAIDQQGKEIFDSNWISQAAHDRTIDQLPQGMSPMERAQLGGINSNDPSVLFTQDLTKAHRLDIQNASVADLIQLKSGYLAIILPELTAQQLSDMVSNSSYTFPSALIPKLSASQADAMLKRIRSLQHDESYEDPYTSTDIVNLERQSKSILQKLSDKLSRRPKAPSPEISKIAVAKSPAPDAGMQQEVNAMPIATGATQAGEVVVSSRVPAKYFRPSAPATSTSPQDPRYEPARNTDSDAPGGNNFWAAKLGLSGASKAVATATMPEETAADDSAGTVTADVATSADPGAVQNLTLEDWQKAVQGKTVAEKEKLSEAYVQTSLAPTDAREYTSHQKDIFNDIKQYLDPDWIEEHLTIRQQQALGITAGQASGTTSPMPAPTAPPAAAAAASEDDAGTPALDDVVGDYYA